LKAVQAQADERLQAQQNQFDAEMKLKDMEESARDREHEAERAEAELALESARIAAAHPDNNPEASAMDKVSENLAYKDLAIPAKKDMLRHVGLSTEGLKDTQVAKAPQPTNGKSASARPLA